VTKGDIGAIIFGVMVVANVALGQLGRWWWPRSAMRARQLSEGTGPIPGVPAACDPSRALVIIEREGGYLRDGLRSYTVVVDGHRVGKIRAGTSFAAEVAAGIHIVQIRIDGFRSVPVRIDCEASSEVRLRCRPRDRSGLGLADFALGLVGRRPWILLDDNKIIANPG
jgi:hypothetical protein